MNLLKYLERQAKLSDSLCISYDELVEWPAEQIEEAKQQGCLVQADDAEGIICRQCPKHCWKDVEIRQKDGQSVGVYFCEDEDCAGLIEIKTERLQQWQISGEKLEALGYVKKKTRKRKRKISSDLTTKETEVFTLIHVKRKTQQQAAIEMGCTAQNVSKLLKNAEAKMKAQNSRSINLRKAQKLPEGRRGQTNISNEDI